MMSRTRSCLVSMVQMCKCKSLYKIDQTKEEHIESKQMSLSCSYLLLTSKVSLYKLRAVHAGSFVYFLSVLYVGSFGFITQVPMSIGKKFYNIDPRPSSWQKSAKPRSIPTRWSSTTSSQRQNLFPKPSELNANKIGSFNF